MLAILYMDYLFIMLKIHNNIYNKMYLTPHYHRIVLIYSFKAGL